MILKIKNHVKLKLVGELDLEFLENISKAIEEIMFSDVDDYFNGDNLEENIKHIFKTKVYSKSLNIFIDRSLKNFKDDRIMLINEIFKIIPNNLKKYSIVDKNLIFEIAKKIESKLFDLANSYEEHIDLTTINQRILSIEK